MEKILLAFTILTAQTTATITETETTAKFIQEYGITTVLCAIIIIFAVAMFNNIIRRTSKTDETVVKLLNDIYGVVNSIKNSDVDIAGSFDKHNTKFVLEVEHLKNALKAMEDEIDDMDHDGISGLRQILVIIDQECSDIRDNVSKLDDSMRKIETNLEQLKIEVNALK